MNATDEQVVAHALSYPFERHRCSCVVSSPGGGGGAGEDATVRPATPDDLESAGRRHSVALLAYGANAAPARLMSKLVALSQPWRIVVARAQLGDFDVAYSAHVSPYGPIPSTIHPSPGTTVCVWVLFLDELTLAPITATEWNYRFGRFDRPRIDVEGVSRSLSLHGYVSRHGALARDGEPVALGAVEAQDRSFRALEQPEMMRLVRDRLAPASEIPQFILGHARDPEVQAQRTALLRSDALSFSHPSWAAIPPE